MHVSDQAHAVSFTRFIDSDDESEYDLSIGQSVIANKSQQIGGGANNLVRQMKCTHCRAQIFEQD